MGKIKLTCTKINPRVVSLKWYGGNNPSGYYVYAGKKLIKNTSKIYFKYKKKAGKKSFRVVPYADIEGKRYTGRSSCLLWWRSIAATDPRYARSTAARLVKRVIHPFTRRLDQYGIAREADLLAQSANATGRVESENLRYLVLVDDCADCMPEDFSDARRAPFEGCAFDVPGRGFRSGVCVASPRQ